MNCTTIGWGRGPRSINWFWMQMAFSKESKTNQGTRSITDLDFAQAILIWGESDLHSKKQAQAKTSQKKNTAKQQYSYIWTVTLQSSRN